MTLEVTIVGERFVNPLNMHRFTDFGWSLRVVFIKLARGLSCAN